jgi:hypothetical protein
VVFALFYERKSASQICRACAFLLEREAVEDPHTGTVGGREGAFQRGMNNIPASLV